MTKSSLKSTILELTANAKNLLNQLPQEDMSQILYKLDTVSSALQCDMEDPKFSFLYTNITAIDLLNKTSVLRYNHLHKKGDIVFNPATRKFEGITQEGKNFRTWCTACTKMIREKFPGEEACIF